MIGMGVESMTSSDEARGVVVALASSFLRDHAITSDPTDMNASAWLMCAGDVPDRPGAAYR